MIGDQLHWNGIDQRRHRRGHFRQHQGHERFDGRFLGALRIGDQNDFAAARGDLLHVRHGFFEHPVVRRNDDHRHGFVDQRDGTMLEFAGGIAFGVDVGNFLELERAFQCDRKAGAAAEIKHVLHLGEIMRELFDLRLERQRLRHQARHLDQGMHQILLVLGRQMPARTAGGQRQTGEHRQLTGESLGRRDADFRPRQSRHHHVALARDGRRRDVHHRQNVLLHLARVAQGRQGVGGLARL